MRFLSLFLIAFAFLGCAIGCGPTRTPGTEGIPPDKLAILHVTQQYDVPALQLAAIGFDDGAKYEIDGDHDFYLTPGVHHVAIDVKPKIDGPMKWLASSFGAGDTKVEGPSGLPTGDLQPGKTYELRGLASAAQGMLNGEQLSITREMPNK